MTLLTSIVAFIIAVGVIVSFHEFGHFWVARRLGVKVLRYSIGFGRPLWRKLGGDGTEYVVAAIPLGGYVRMLDEREAPVAPEQLHRAFNRKPLASRAAIVAAGPVFNFILALLLYYLMFMVGVNGIKPIIGEVTSNSVAEQAGIVAGDQLAEIAGTEVESWQQALFALLDVSFKGSSFELMVVDFKGAGRQLVMHTGNLDPLRESDVLGALGLRPYYPQADAVIAKILPTGSAADSPLRVGDHVVSFAGREVRNWAELVRLTQANPGNTVNVIVLRDGEPVEFEMQVGTTRENGRNVGYLGVSAQQPSARERARLRTFVRYGAWDSLSLAAAKTWSVTVLTLKIMKRLLFGEASWSNISGPVGIAEYAGLSLLQGLGAFLGLLALLSVSIGILNLLPVPMLDGGHLLYYLIEFIKGSPVSMQTQVVGQWLGVFMLGGLMVLALYNDFSRLFG